jgi:hypothetical protein
VDAESTSTPGQAAREILDLKNRRAAPPRIFVALRWINRTSKSAPRKFGAARLRRFLCDKAFARRLPGVEAFCKLSRNT